MHVPLANCHCHCTCDAMAGCKAPKVENACAKRRRKEEVRTSLAGGWAVGSGRTGQAGTSGRRAVKESRKEKRTWMECQWSKKPKRTARPKRSRRQVGVWRCYPLLASRAAAQQSATGSPRGQMLEGVQGERLSPCPDPEGGFNCIEPTRSSHLPASRRPSSRTKDPRQA